MSGPMCWEISGWTKRATSGLKLILIGFGIEDWSWKNVIRLARSPFSFGWLSRPCPSILMIFPLLFSVYRSCSHFFPCFILQLSKVHRWGIPKLSCRKLFRKRIQFPFPLQCFHSAVLEPLKKAFLSTFCWQNSQTDDTCCPS